MKLLEKILVPVDLENTSYLNQVSTAVNLAEKFYSEVLILHVLPQAAKGKSINSIVLKYIEPQLDSIVKDIENKGIRVRKIISYGNSFEQIMQWSESEDVNLIVTAKSSQLFKEHEKVDVHSEKILRKSMKPVWFVNNVDDHNSKPQSILCPVDFSSASARALENAIKIARTFNSKLHVINVFEPLQESFSPRYNINYQEENLKLENDNTVEFDEFLNHFNFTDVNFDVQVLKGKPHLQIIEFTKLNNIDLILMGATGKSYLQRILLGSITEMIIKDLPCSLVVTKAENIIDLKIEKDISELEKHLHQAERLEATGYYQEAIDQLKICLQLNDIHLPTLNKLSKLYQKLGNEELAENYKSKSLDVLKRLWDRKIELDLRRGLKL